MRKLLLDFSLDEKKFLALASYFSDIPGTALLYSGGEADSAVNSFLFLFPKKAFAIVFKDKSYKKQFDFEEIIYIDGTEGGLDNWGLLKKAINEPLKNQESFPLWMGFLSYEFALVSKAEDDKKRPGAKDESLQDEKALPLAYFLSYALVAKYNHKAQSLEIFLSTHDIDHLPIFQKRWMERFSKASFWRGFLKDLSLDLLKNKSKDEGRSIAREKDYHLEIDGEEALSLREGGACSSSLACEKWSCFKEKSLQNCSFHPFGRKDEYIGKISKIQELIKEGDVYEVNLSHELILEPIFTPSTFSIFLELCHINPAPFSSFIGLKDFSIVSSSPERFLCKENTHLESRPIKGTINRGKTESEDQKNRELLLSSEKEKSELRMITDLLRNDFYQVCLKGTIKAKELFRIEKYANVFQMLSIIEGECKKNVHPVDIIKACFPGGSITGCPKAASMDVISCFEKRERGIYTGCIGYITSTGDFDFSIAIRTLLFLKEKIYLPVGGAILLDSDPEKEYLETFYKAQSMLEALKIEVRL